MKKIKILQDPAVLLTLITVLSIFFISIIIYCYMNVSKISTTKRNLYDEYGIIYEDDLIKAMNNVTYCYFYNHSVNKNIIKDFEKIKTHPEIKTFFFENVAADFSSIEKYITTGIEIIKKDENYKKALKEKSKNKR